MVLSIPIKYELFSNGSIQTIDRTLTGSTIPGESGSGSNGDEK